MFIHTIDPVLVGLGPLEIRWYGLVYFLGFLGTMWWLTYLRKRSELSLTKDEIWDLGFYMLVGVLVGSRVFEVFWEPEYYLSNFWNIFKIWEGGMSFHGGFVGIIIGTYLFCRKNKMKFLDLADKLTFPTMLALAFGRVANFVNGELWGTVTNASWCVNFRNTGGGDVCRHPQQLYAFGYRLLISVWLLFLSLKSKFKAGFIFWNFMLLEGIGRFVVD